MRPDLHHLLVERPRTARDLAKASSRAMRRIARMQPPDDLAALEGMAPRARSPKRIRKALSDNLAPLFRLLAAQVGRPWRLVFAELSAHTRGSSAVKLHVLAHVRHIVVEDVRLDDTGRPYSVELGYLDGLSGIPHRDVLYVHPIDGLLKRVKRRWDRGR